MVGVRVRVRVRVSGHPSFGNSKSNNFYFLP
jgi:hypothetical protein